jgi:hypothetical protein
LIFLADLVDHQQYITEVLMRLCKYSLYVKLSKYQFGIKMVDFLDYILSLDSVVIECSQVDTIIEWLEPKSFREIQIFLDFANFY